MTKPRIRNDAAGVPHISSDTWTGVFEGLGYCHARDRGLQMLTLRTVGRGRTSELRGAGDEALASDLFFRRMNWAGDAHVEAARFTPQAREVVDAYCRGVNKRFAEKLPFELRLLGYRHEPWTAADIVTLSRLGGWLTLAQSQAEVERLLVEMVRAGVSRELLEELFPGQLAELDMELIRRLSLSPSVVPASVKWNTSLPRLMASNNWVIAGSRTVSGKPIFSNDPHLAATLPNVWYESVLSVGGRYALGASIPGVPGISVGRTNDVAWGATYAFMDTVDSWVEDCRDGCARRETTGGERWVPLRLRREVIARRGASPHEAVFFENEHGTLDGDPRVEGFYLATRWSAAYSAADSIAAMLRMLDAPDVETAMECVGGFGQLSVNWVLADRHGNIGYQMSGRMPRRRDGVSGLVPLPGWKAENDWQGFVDAHELPRVLNPAQGFFVTANEDLNAWGVAKPINMPMGAYRADRIAALIRAREHHDLASVQGLYYDVYSLQAERFLEVLGPLLPDTEAGRLLADWDLRYEPDSRGATLFEEVYAALMKEVFGGVLGEAFEHLVRETGTFVDFYANADAILLAPESGWFGGRTREEVARAALARALPSGSVADVPRWGERNRLVIRNLLLGGRLPAWTGFDRGPFEIRGGRATVHQGQIYRLTGRDTSFVPSLRLCADLAEDGAWSNLCGGASDRRFSRFYASGIEGWLGGRFKRLVV